jgi:hypothetical protein
VDGFRRVHADQPDRFDAPVIEGDVDGVAVDHAGYGRWRADGLGVPRPQGDGGQGDSGQGDRGGADGGHASLLCMRRTHTGNAMVLRGPGAMLQDDDFHSSSYWHAQERVGEVRLSDRDSVIVSWSP